ncbi:hypothetical protein Tco_1467001 [Tanacetum coccineum]
MTGNKCYLTEYEDYDGRFVSFGDGKGRISGKGTRDNIVAGQADMKTKPEQEYILIPFYTTDPLISQGPKDSEEDSGMNPTGNGYSLKDKNQAKTDKTKHGNRKSMKNEKDNDATTMLDSEKPLP